MKDTFSRFLIGSIFLCLNLGLVTANYAQSEKPREIPRSKLGLKGQPGFIVRVLDAESPLKQAGIKPFDIIIGTDLTGQFKDMEQFLREIGKVEPGTDVKIKFLRFDPSVDRYTEQTVTVKTIPFSMINKSTSLNHPSLKAGASMNRI